MLRQFISIIPKEKRVGGVAVAIGVFVRSLLNLIGVAALVPVLMIILDPGAAIGLFPNAEEGSLTYALSSWLSSHSSLVVAIALGAIVIKGIANMLLLRSQTAYLLDLYKYFSGSLFDRLFAKGLLFVKDNHSANLSYNINGACYNLSTAYLSNLFTLVSEILFCILVVVALAIVNPAATLIACACLAPMVAVYYFLVRSRLSKLGKEEFDIRRGQHKRVQNAFKGYSELVLSGSFPEILDQYRSSIDEISGIRKKMTTLGSLPSLMLEFAAIILLSILALTHFSIAGQDSVVFIGLFAAALVRMIPALRSIVSAWSSMRQSRYSFDLVYDYFKEENPEHPNEPRQPLEHELRLENVSFAFSLDSPKLLNDVSFSISRGEIVGFRGPSGSGKTTLFNILLGFYSPTEGRILVDGEPLRPSGWHAAVGYVSQEVFIDDSLTLAQNIALGDSAPDLDRVRNAVQKAQLSSLIDALPQGLDTLAGEQGSKISIGQKQRLGIARALYKQAGVLFFDEATSSLDGATESQIDQEILALHRSNPNLTILIISHRDSSLTICDRIIDISEF